MFWHMPNLGFGMRDYSRSHIYPALSYHLFVTMAQMAHFSFPYYFTIPNSEFRIPKFVKQTERSIILIYFNSANV